MKALHFDKTLSVKDIPLPEPNTGEAIIKVLKAGICNTDLEILKGYIKGFNGIPGHEFIGVVEDVSSSEFNYLVNRKVTAEINCVCNRCEMCMRGLPRHCRNRSVLGIDRRNGAFAEYISVPLENIVPIPENISDNSALFIEPLAAAFEIQQQIKITSDQKVLLIGDGKLAHLTALSLKQTGCQLTVFGKHTEKISLLERYSIRSVIEKDQLEGSIFDVVIEASGSPNGFTDGIGLVRPRGIFILKSTYASDLSFNPASVVVDEISIIGSRCGSFEPAVRFLSETGVDLSYLISRIYPLSEGVTAFHEAQKTHMMKIIIDCTR
jgi:threonine dehydrogenase-like Zn-dependent dehydrogenase